MIATKTNLEITEYREKFFLGLSLRQLACFAAAAVLAIATCFVCLHWLRMDMQVVSYIVMVEVLPFLGLGFIHRDGYPFEKLVKIYWAWHSENAAVPIRPYKESRNVQKKRTRRNSECETYCRRDKKAARKGRKAAVKAAAQIRNIKKYLLAALYNAPLTIENYYAAQINHDLYGRNRGDVNWK